MKKETKIKLLTEVRPSLKYYKNGLIDAIASIAFYLIQDPSGVSASERYNEMIKRGHLKVENDRQEQWIWEMAEQLAYPPVEKWRK